MMIKAVAIATLLTTAAIVIHAWSVVAGIISNEPREPSRTQPASPPLYASSVVGTDFDFITEDDPSTFRRLTFVGFKAFEMPDKRGLRKQLKRDAFVFDAFFSDGTKVSIALDAEFGSRQAAEQDAERYGPPLGKLPSLYRKKLRHVVVHKGGADTTAFAEDKGHFFVIYSDNASRRISSHDLEETFFHEATHASIQTEHLDGSEWRNAKRRDIGYITKYATSEDQEDFAESALFAYTLMRYPERFAPLERERIIRQIPNRIAFFRSIFGE